MKKRTKKRSLLILVILAIIAVIGYRYSSKRLELYGHYDKVWAHRVNDLKKLRSAKGNFAGVELDLVYMPKIDKLDIHHPPKPPSKLYFEQYFKSLKDKSLPLWLDLKNLNTENAEAVLNRLESIFKTEKNSFQRKNIIIESQQVESLHVFRKKGYRTSWYIAKRFSKANAKKMKAKITKGLHHPEIELSSNYHNYPYLQKVFPQRTKNFWIMTSTYDPETLENYSLIRKLIADKNVKTVLIPYVNFNRHY